MSTCHIWSVELVKVFYLFGFVSQQFFMNFLLRIQWKQGHFLSLCQMELGNTGPFSARWICCCDVFIGLFCSYGKLRKKSLYTSFVISFNLGVKCFPLFWTLNFSIFPCFPMFCEGSFFALYFRRSTFYCPSHGANNCPKQKYTPRNGWFLTTFFFVRPFGCPSRCLASLPMALKQ